jgi:parvulin-like peptidyl-prolyl isomerase
MNIKDKIIFPIALGALVLAFPPAQAAAANASTGTPPAGANTNVNLSATMTALFGNPVVARGKGFEIKQTDLDELMTGVKAAAAMRNQSIPPEQVKMIESQMLNRLIQVQLLLQTATDADRVEGKQLADSQMKTLVERAGSQEALNRQFMALGMSMDQLRTRLVQESTAQAALVRGLKVTVTDAEAKQFYNDHPAEFEQPEMVHIEQIFLSIHDPITGTELSDENKAAKKKELDDILKRARAGEDFKKLVAQYSEDPTSKNKGGEYTIARGQTLPEFEAAAFSLNTNQISDVVITTGGYHLIKLLEKLPAKKLDFASVTDNLKKALIQQKSAKLAPAFMADLRKQGGVEILDPDLKALEQASESAAGTGAPTAPVDGK